jgi:serine/threonine protein phosphatase PrpC
VDVLSLDHKPCNNTEYKRIQAAGGWVELNRVNGNLALSRALGDFVFKRNEEKTAEEQIVTGKLRSLLKLSNTLTFHAKPSKQILVLNSFACILATY